MMGADITRPLVVLAPGIHVGGGLVLLQAFLTSSSANVRWLLIDERARGKLEPQGNAVVHYVKRSVFSRLSAEWRLRKGAKETDVVLCFHGLPPLFSLPGRVVVFLQNRILVNDQALSDYPPFTRARLRFERLMLRVFSHHVDRFIVQTPSMASDVARKLGKRPEVSEVAFAAELHTGSGSLPNRYDFVYVAGDDVHKNHAVLLDAWRLLAIDGLRPTLALTLPRASTLASAIEQLRQDGLSHITNLGRIVSSGGFASVWVMFCIDFSFLYGVFWPSAHRGGTTWPAGTRARIGLCA